MKDLRKGFVEKDAQFTDPHLWSVIWILFVILESLTVGSVSMIRILFLRILPTCDAMMVELRLSEEWSVTNSDYVKWFWIWCMRRKKKYRLSLKEEIRYNSKCLMFDWHSTLKQHILLSGIRNYIIWKQEIFPKDYRIQKSVLVGTLRYQNQMSWHWVFFVTTGITRADIGCFC